MTQPTTAPKTGSTTKPTPHPTLPLTAALIATAETPSLPLAWSAIKNELKTYLKDLHQREEAHRDHKVATLEKWKAKAGMLEKKRMAGLPAEADEHDQMHAAGVPGHIMLQFRETEAAFEKENLFFQGKLKELRALGFREEDVGWVWSRKMEDDDGH
ncbi:hypothetical protein P171DRAFT_449341 [Karstenula rhodostoma CBS 690.94]|uniref:Uncharacterized protein n=1 Tax=Karstenula rhodostoma CBS 690.94 TaxID=1392251 RepID=A0A9P4P6G5_9PLEO|nr:hypothetical protein P171DRAFT_449341 [Karstenula rhodostoma CBS 690.94]